MTFQHTNSFRIKNKQISIKRQDSLAEASLAQVGYVRFKVSKKHCHSSQVSKRSKRNMLLFLCFGLFSHRSLKEGNTEDILLRAFWRWGWGAKQTTFCFNPHPHKSDTAQLYHCTQDSLSRTTWALGLYRIRIGMIFRAPFQP